MSARVCHVADCRAVLQFPKYVVVTLDDGKSVAVCRECWKKISAAQKGSKGGSK